MNGRRRVTIGAGREEERRMVFENITIGRETLGIERSDESKMAFLPAFLKKARED
jgi:hypothetical protein